MGRDRRGQQAVRRRGALGPGDGGPWRDLPPDYGGWKNTHRRFRGWRDKRVWERLPGELAGEPDPGWLMVDATHAEVHHDGTEATGGSEGVGRTKGGPTRRHAWPQVRLVCQPDSLPRLVPRRIAGLLSS